jgi:hypothetical protein
VRFAVGGDSAEVIGLAALLVPRWHVLAQLRPTADTCVVELRTDHWPCLRWLDAWLDPALRAAAAIVER